jgi:archaellum biogenesis ATPase FlaH
LERQLLASFIKSRAAFEEVRQHVKHPEQAFSDVGKLIYQCSLDYYERDENAQCIEKDVLLANLEKRIGNEKQFKRIEEVVKALPDASVPNVLGTFLQQRKHSVAQELSAALLLGKDDKARPLLDQWERLDDGELESQSDTAEVYSGLSVQAVLDPLKRENLFRLWPLSLNEHTDGGAARGDHILVSGRVENGKSLLVINMACGFAFDKHKVLYIGNEDSAQRMLPRFVSRLTGWTKDELRVKDPRDVDAKLNKMGWSNLTFVSLPPSSTLDQIEMLVDKYIPDVLIVDQLRNVSANDSDLTKSLEKVAVGMRTLIKSKHILGVSVVQSMNNNEHINKLVGDMGDVADSKVGIPGQADLLVILGTNEEYRNRSMGMLTVAKNKLSGWHGHFPVQFIPQLSKVEDLGG